MALGTPVRVSSRKKRSIASPLFSSRQKTIDTKVKVENTDSVIPENIVSSSAVSPCVQSSSFNDKDQKIVSYIIKSNDGEKGLVSRPTPNECYYATLSLSSIHPEVVSKNDSRRQTLLESCGMRDDVTDAVISTMLSQNTTDKNSKAAFKSLKETFKSWDDVVDCEDVSRIEDSIRVAGLAKTRAERIQTMLQTVKEERGSPSLDYIKNIENDDDVKKELSRFKGLGPKTISCVLLFALGRSEFPVDTHVLRITKQMGWVKPNETREGAYSHLNSLVPNDLKMDLHCLLVQHGKCCHRCAAKGRPQFPPKNGSKLLCPLTQIPKWVGNIPENELKSVQLVKTEDNVIGNVVKSEEVAQSDDAKRSKNAVIKSDL